MYFPVIFLVTNIYDTLNGYNFFSDLELTYDMDANRVQKRAKLLDRSLQKFIPIQSANITLQKGITTSVSKLVFVKLNACTLFIYFLDFLDNNT